MHSIHVIDSHTGGEPTRIIMSGGPELGSGDMKSKLVRFQTDFDHFRSAVVNEPRGSDVMVGAIYCPPESPDQNAGVIFFNNVGYLGMCGHGTIGLMVTLLHLGLIDLGCHTIDTPVGPVRTTIESRNEVRIENVVSYRKQSKVEIEVEGIGRVEGDVAWGGNWFFLVDLSEEELRLDQIETLTERAWSIRKGLNAQGYPEVDHIEFFSSDCASDAHSKNFVLCPGKAYDRSPCGTGTSAKLACLAADQKLEEGATWIQESILGSKFSGKYHWLDEAKTQVVPEIKGTAFVMADSKLLLDDADVFRWGIR